MMGAIPYVKLNQDGHVLVELYQVPKIHAKRYVETSTTIIHILVMTEIPFQVMDVMRVVN